MDVMSGTDGDTGLQLTTQCPTHMCSIPFDQLCDFNDRRRNLFLSI